MALLHTGASRNWVSNLHKFTIPELNNHDAKIIFLKIVIASIIKHCFLSTPKTCSLATGAYACVTNASVFVIAQANSLAILLSGHIKLIETVSHSKCQIMIHCIQILQNIVLHDRYLHNILRLWLTTNLWNPRLACSFRYLPTMLLIGTVSLNLMDTTSSDRNVNSTHRTK